MFFFPVARKHEPRYKNKFKNKFSFIGIFELRLSYIPATPGIFYSRDIRRPRCKNPKKENILKLFLYPGCRVSRLPRNTIWSLYHSCHVVPQQVQFRLPRRRDLPAILRSLFKIPYRSQDLKSMNFKFIGYIHESS